MPSYAIVGIQDPMLIAGGFSSSEEAQRVAKQERFDQIQRYEIREYESEQQLNEYIANRRPVTITPDRGRPIPSNQIVQDVATGKYVPTSQSTQANLSNIQKKQLQIIEKAKQEELFDQQTYEAEKKKVLEGKAYVSSAEQRQAAELNNQRQIDMALKLQRLGIEVFESQQPQPKGAATQGVEYREQILNDSRIPIGASRLAMAMREKALNNQLGLGGNDGRTSMDNNRQRFSNTLNNISNSVYDKASSIYEKVEAKKQQIEEKLFKRKEEFQTAGEYVRQQESAGRKLPLARTLSTAGYIGLGGLTFVSQLGLRPYESVKGTLSFLGRSVTQSPIKTFGEVSQPFKEEPVFTTSGLVTQSILLQKITPLAKKPFQAARAKIPFSIEYTGIPKDSIPGIVIESAKTGLKRFPGEPIKLYGEALKEGYLENVKPVGKFFLDEAKGVGGELGRGSYGAISSIGTSAKEGLKRFPGEPIKLYGEALKEGYLENVKLPSQFLGGELKGIASVVPNVGKGIVTSATKGLQRFPGEALQGYSNAFRDLYTDEIKPVGQFLGGEIKNASSIIPNIANGFSRNINYVVGGVTLSAKRGFKRFPGEALGIYGEGLKSGYRQFKQPSFFIAGGLQDLVRTGGFPFKLKYTPFVKYSASGIKVVEGTTIPTSLQELKQFEGTKADTIHTTFSGLDYGDVLKPGTPESVGAFRKSIGQFNFYQSLPKGKPLAYGGYIGIGDAYSAGTRYTFNLFNPTPKAIIFRGQEILPTPKNIIGKGIIETTKFQTEKAGTYIPSENLFGKSIERQATTSVGSSEKPLFQLAKNENAPLEGKFTYYNVKKPFPEILGGTPEGKSILSKIIKNPEQFVNSPKGLGVSTASSQFNKILGELKGEDVAITGGLARRIALGKGRVRDLDIVVKSPEEGLRLGTKVASKYPEYFKVIQHEKFPEIFRLKDIKKNKVIADFDPINLAEEGLIKSDSFYNVGGFKVVKPDVLLKSKALQIQKGKSTGKQFKNIADITGNKITPEKLKSTKTNANPTIKKIYDLFTSKNVRIDFKEAKLERVGKSTLSSNKVVDLNEYSASYGKIKPVSLSQATTKSSLLLSNTPTKSSKVISQRSNPLVDLFRSSQSRSSSPKTSLSYDSFGSSGSSSFRSSGSSSRGSSGSSSSGSSSFRSSGSSSRGSSGSSSSGSSSFRSSGSSSRGSSGSSSSSSSSYSSGITTTSPLLSLFDSKEKSNTQSGYDVYIKKKQSKQGKGKYQSRGYEKANTSALTQTAAKGLGASIVDKYTNATYIIKKVKQTAQNNLAYESAWNNLKDKFTQKGNRFTEKVKHRISSYEEKQGIPYEAQRLKGMFAKPSTKFSFGRRAKA